MRIAPWNEMLWKCVLIFSLVLPLYSYGVGACSEGFLGEKASFVEKENVTYIFRPDSVHVLLTDGKGEILKTLVHRIGEGGAAHLDIIRRQIGDEKFLECFKSKNPLVALDRVVAEEIRKIPSRPGSTTITDLRRFFSKYSYQNPVPESLLKNLYSWLEMSGFGHRSTQTWVERYATEILNKQTEKRNIFVKELPVVGLEIPVLRENGEVSSENIFFFAQFDKEGGRMSHSSLFPIIEDVLGKSWGFDGNKYAKTHLLLHLRVDLKSQRGSFLLKTLYYGKIKHKEAGAFRIGPR